MIKKILVLALCFSWIPAMAAEPATAVPAEESCLKPDGSIAGLGFRSLTPEDADLWGQMMTNRAALPPEVQAIYPSGTHAFHFTRTEERKRDGVRYHCVAITPEGLEPTIANTMFASIGVFSRHGYNATLYPAIIASLNALGVTGDDKPGIATFAAFMDPSITSQALSENVSALVGLVGKLRAADEKLPEERSQGSADIKIRVVPDYLAVLFHPNHPIVRMLEAQEFARLKDSTNKDSHAFDIYIDGPVNAVLTALAKRMTYEEVDKDAREALKKAIKDGSIIATSLWNLIEEVSRAQDKTLPWRSTFILPLTVEAQTSVASLSSVVVSRTEHRQNLNSIFMDVVMRKLMLGEY